MPDFTPANQETPFDCEAFIATEDSLILFTKNWVNLTTRLYTLPVIAGDYSANFRKQWNIDGLITSAAWSADTRDLYLLGYTMAPFVWIYSGFDADNLNFNARERIDFTNFLGTQTEGILITTEGSVLISSEAVISLGKPAGLFVLEVSD